MVCIPSHLDHSQWNRRYLTCCLGRGIGVVPRTIDPRGYADLNLDSYDGFLADLLEVSTKASIRVETN